MSKKSYEHVPPKILYDGRLLHELLDAKAEQCPDTEAIIMYDVDLNRSVMTFAEWQDRWVFQINISLKKLYLEHPFLNLQYVPLYSTWTAQ